ncbi:hypothetical protein EON63_09145 [archaeon]|nr:MAG: hypothetical protein EON63_09145 [archaeon]
MVAMSCMGYLWWPSTGMRGCMTGQVGLLLNTVIDSQYHSSHTPLIYAIHHSSCTIYTYIYAPYTIRHIPYTKHHSRCAVQHQGARHQDQHGLQWGD